jgi:hypothetical protein
MSSSSVITSTSFAVDGKTYDNVASLPAEVQAVLRNMLPGLTGAAAPAATPPLAVPAPAAAPAPTVGQPLAEGEVMLNGVPTRVGSEPARKKHWWRRG